MPTNYTRAIKPNLPVVGSIQDSYVCPANTQSIVRSVHICNTDGATDYFITMKVYDAAAVATAVWTNAHQCPINTEVELIDRALVLKAGDKIQLGADVANKLDAVISVVELT